MVIDGSPDLSKWIVGHGDSCVFSIEMGWPPQWAGEYFLINVEAQGPAGFFAGSLGLVFGSRKQPSEDQYLKEGPSAFGEIWKYDVFDSTKKQHSTSFRSDASSHGELPGIEEIRWWHRPWYVPPFLSGAR